MTIKILLVKTSALGDIAQTLPVVNYLQKKSVGILIDWVVEKAGAELVQAHPGIDRTLVIDTKRWRKHPIALHHEITAFRTELKKRYYDVVFDLQGNTKSALVTWSAKATYKVGFGIKSVPEILNVLATNIRFNPRLEGNIVERNLSIVKQFLHDDSRWVMEQNPLIKRAPSEGLVFMLCFGSSWENKKISLCLWKEFLAKMSNKDRFFLSYGSETEQKEAKELALALGKRATLLPKMSLPLWQEKMALMDGVIAVDSVGLHLAALVGVPTFSFFGPSSAAIYQPRGEKHAGIQGSCPYGISFEKRCPQLRTCKTGLCLKRLSIDDVWSDFQEWRSTCQNRYVSPQDQ